MRKQRSGTQQAQQTADGARNKDGAAWCYQRHAPLTITEKELRLWLVKVTHAPLAERLTMSDTTALGERIAALEAQVAESNARDRDAAEDRERKWDALNAIREKVDAVSTQQTLMNSRIESIGQMAQVAKDFVAAAREIPTRSDFTSLKDESHATNIRLAELSKEFTLVKEARDATVSRMWAVITGALTTGVSALIGVVMTWASRH